MGHARVEPQGGAGVGDGLVVAALGGVSEAAVVVGGRTLWIEPQGRVEVGQGRAVLLHAGQRIAAVAIGEGELGSWKPRKKGGIRPARRQTNAPLEALK